MDHELVLAICLFRLLRGHTSGRENRELVLAFCLFRFPEKRTNHELVLDFKGVS
jgi:hypothetical protein